MEESKKAGVLLKLYLQWPVLLSVWMVAANISVFFMDLGAGMVMVFFTAVCAGLSISVYFRRKQKLLRNMVEFASDLAQAQKALLTTMELPYGIMDNNGKLLWMNRALEEVVCAERSTRKNILSIFPELDRNEWEQDVDEIVSHVEYHDQYYRVVLKKIDFDKGMRYRTPLNEVMVDSMLIAVYLFNETDLISYKVKAEAQQLVVGLIYLDNYDEALESVEEVRRSLLVALIDRKINKYFSAMDGIINKIEKDKYFVAFKQMHMQSLQEERFSLLEDVKTVNIGNEMSVTLSIGMGMNGDSYNQNYANARTSIDMALGRGGDQAVVKDGGKILYYGGKSQQVEKTTRVKARVKAHALRELMDTKDRLLIMGHKIGDIDSLGAAIGVWRIASSLNKKAHIVINEVTSSVRPMLERFVSGGDYPDDMFVKGNKAVELADTNTMLVVVDVNKPSYTESPELLEQVKTIVVLDHHRQGSEVIHNAVLSYIEPYASSTCEMVAEVIQYIADGIRMKSAEADVMYAGIVIDTNNFMNKTGVRTFEAAAYLRRNGADVTRVRKLFRDNMVDYKAKAEAVRNAEVFEGAYAITVAPAEGIESPTVIGAQVANELLNIIGIKASFVMTELNHTIYISARSIDEVNVQIVMERLGGGGHMTTAGAQLKGVAIEEAVVQVKELIKTMIQEGAV